MKVIAVPCPITYITQINGGYRNGARNKGMKIMVGGTFDPLHDGHKRLISRSFELAGQKGCVIIGLTTDQFAQMKTHPVRPYREREERLVSFINSQPFSSRWSIEPLIDRFGSAVDVDFDALVVSEETLPAAVEINRLRHQKGRKKVDIHQISCVLAEDGRWISSTRIYRGEIDDHGNIRVK
jgi:pantetheine-phosphate adenylyltransferase